MYMCATLHLPSRPWLPYLLSPPGLQQSYSTQSSLVYGEGEGGGIHDRTDVALFCGAIGVTYGIDYAIEELAKV